MPHYHHHLMPLLLVVGLLTGCSGGDGGDSTEGQAPPEPLFVVADNGSTGAELFVLDALTHSVSLLLDINTRTRPSTLMNSRGARLGDALVFAADDHVHGRQLWITDGTDAGTRLLATICNEGCEIAAGSILAAAGRVFFLATDPAHGSELWVTDGTAEGTERLTDIHSGSADSDIRIFAVADTGIYFSYTNDDGISSLWRSDGTPAGTLKYSDANRGPLWGFPIELAPVIGDVAYFIPGGMNTQLWRTDGTAAGTFALRNFQELDPPSYKLIESVVRVGQSIYFAVDNVELANNIELWRTDGTVAGTVQVPLTLPSEFLFASGSSIYIPKGNQLWRIHGTSEALELVYTFSADIQYFPAGTSNDGIYIAVPAADGTELWYSDGSSTVPVAGMPVIPAAYINLIGSDGNRSWMSVGDGSVPYDQLFVVEGTTATYLTESSQSPALGALGNRLIFPAADAIHGFEPWISDGTLMGTHLLADINATTLTSSPSTLVHVGDRWFFTASDGEREHLWTTDRTPAGTIALSLDYRPSAHYVSGWRGIALAGKFAFLSRDNAGATHLWSSDGTDAGTQSVLEICAAADAEPDSWQYLARGPGVIGLIHSSCSGFSLWHTDGTAGGTAVIRAFSVEEGEVYGATVVGGYLAYFTRYPSGLWRTDGTAAGTVNISAAFGTPEHFDQPVAIGNTVYVVTHSDGNASLWRTNGTAAGTIHLLDLGAAEVSDPVAAGNNLYFIRNNPETPALTGLWRFNSRSGELLRIVATDMTSPMPTLTPAGNYLYFNTVSPDAALWRTDGTTAGTTRLIDYLSPYELPATACPNNDDRYSYQISDFRSEGSELYFIRYDTLAGVELWHSDGTVNGTQLVSDIWPGTACGAFAIF